MPASTASIRAERLADLSSLESCSASDSARIWSPNCSATTGLTAAARRSSAMKPRGHAHVVAAHHDVLAGVGGDAGKLGRDHGRDGLRDAGQAALGQARVELRAVARLEVGLDARVVPLRLAGLLLQLDLSGADALDRLVGHRQRLEDDVLVDLLGAGLDHGDRVRRAADDQVERGVLHLGQRRVERQLALDDADPDGCDRAEERQRRQHQCSRGAVDREHVVRGDEVGREHGADDLHLVAESLRPERPDRAVDHARVERCALGSLALTLEEAAGDLARGVHLLLDVDGEREEVDPFPGLRSTNGGRENSRLAARDEDRAVCLLRKSAGGERDVVLADRHGDGLLGLGGGSHVRPFLDPRPIARAPPEKRRARAA